MQPEQIRSLELGYHRQGSRVLRSFDLKLFQDLYTDLIESVGGLRTNATDARIRGLEFEGELEPVRDWRLHAGLSRLWSDLHPVAFDGAERSEFYHSVPNWIVNLDTRYTIGSLTLGAGYNWFDRVIWNGNGDPEPFSNVASLRLHATQRFRIHASEAWLRLVLDDPLPPMQDYYRVNVTEPRLRLELGIEQ